MLKWRPNIDNSLEILRNYLFGAAQCDTIIIIIVIIIIIILLLLSFIILTQNWENKHETDARHSSI